MHNVLVDGGTIRKLWIGEAAKYRDHLLRLDPESRRNRFGGAVSDQFIENFVELTHGLDAVLHGFFVDGVLRGAAELRTLGSALAHEAEAAFSIEKPWQSHGVGSELLERTLLAARNRGIQLVHMTCLANNQRMQQLARKFDAELTFDFGSVVGEVEASFPTPMSMLREMSPTGTALRPPCLMPNRACSRPAAAGPNPQARRRLPPHRVRRRSRCARKTAQNATPGTSSSDTAGAPPGSPRPAGSMYRAIAPG